MSAVFLESERLWFRAPEASDVPFFTRALQDQRVNRQLLFGRYPFSEADESAWFDQVTGPPARDGKTDVVMTFGLRGEFEPLGNTGLHGVSMLHRHASWGLFIGRPEEWGKGYGREVAGTMLEYAFNTLNLNRVELSVSADNERGIRAYLAAGYVHEGVKRKHLYRDGEYVDLNLMAVLRDEWEAARRAT